MNQLAKTGIFVGVAVVAVVVAVLASMPRRFGTSGDDPTELLFRDFQDPAAAHSMEIVKFDEDTGTRHEFKVARGKDERGRDLWRITSQNKNYPADASTQLAGAATALLNKQRGARLSSNRSQHGTYGVLDPSEDGKSDERGKGTLVVFQGENEKELAQLIIGKEVKDKPSQRYVRIRGHDAVYQAEIDASKFSTKFEDWIERDLLKLDAWKVKEVIIQDRALTPRGVEIKGTLQLKYDGSADDNRWQLTDLADGEKLEEAKLNDLRNALDELKIVDVNRKHPALAALLGGKKEDRQHDPAEMERVEDQLGERGFLIGQRGIVPSDGVVVVQMEDGLLYQLFFGGLASLTADQNEASRKKDENPDDEKEDTEKDDTKKNDTKKDDKAEGAKKDKAVGSNRYVFVTVHVNEDFVKKPEINPLPGESLLPGAPTAEKAAEEPKKEASETEDAKPAAKSPKTTLADSVKELRRLQEEGLMEPADYDLKRKQTREANQDAQKRYEDDLKAAGKREKELNERFADWYYVIDDEVYRKIRVKRADIVKASEKPKDEAGKEKGKEKGKDETSSGAPAKTGKTKTP